MSKDDVFFVCLGRQENSIRWMTNETEIDTIVIDKVMKFWDLLFCDCCYIGICLLYSPRVWRWSHDWNRKEREHQVFSTCVEVILMTYQTSLENISILHVCGGDPNIIKLANYWLFYSPRVWRWSPSQNIVKQLHPVFSTYVEVILSLVAPTKTSICILHVCGGIAILGFLKKSWM